MGSGSFAGEPCASADLHEVEAGDFVDGRVRDDAVLLGVDDGRADEAGQQQVGAHGAHLAHLQALHARQRLVHLRDDPAQAVREAVRVLLQVADELVDQGHQLGLVGLHGRLHPLPVGLGALLPEALLLGRGEALRHLGRVRLQVVLVLHQQLHDGLVEGGGEEELGRVQAFGEELEQDAEGAGAPPQQTAGVVALLQLKLHQVPEDLAVAKDERDT